MTELPIQQILLDVVNQIERQGVPYAVMGGFAARAWGLPRPTFDADIAVAVDADGMQRLLNELEHAGFDVPQEHRTGFLDSVGEFQKARVNSFVDGHVWTTDLFVVRGALLNSALGRARTARIGPKQVQVFAPEDVVLLKLIANRRKDLADIEEVLAVCPDLDQKYLMDWAAKLGVMDRLRPFLSGP